MEIQKKSAKCLSQVLNPRQQGPQERSKKKFTNMPGMESNTGMLGQKRAEGKKTGIQNAPSQDRTRVCYVQGALNWN